MSGLVSNTCLVQHVSELTPLFQPCIGTFGSFTRSLRLFDEWTSAY